MRAFSPIASEPRSQADATRPEDWNINTRFAYNPTVDSIRAIAPSVPAILLMFFPAILMAISVAREREIGTIINFHVTPTRRLEFLLGKAAALYRDRHAEFRHHDGDGGLAVWRPVHRATSRFWPFGALSM